MMDWERHIAAIWRGRRGAFRLVREGMGVGVS